MHVLSAFVVAQLTKVDRTGRMCPNDVKMKKIHARSLAHSVRSKLDKTSTWFSCGAAFGPLRSLGIDINRMLTPSLDARVRLCSHGEGRCVGESVLSFSKSKDSFLLSCVDSLTPRYKVGHGYDSQATASLHSTLLCLQWLKKQRTPTPLLRLIAVRLTIVKVSLYSPENKELDSVHLLFTQAIFILFL